MKRKLNQSGWIISTGVLLICLIILLLWSIVNCNRLSAVENGEGLERGTTHGIGTPEDWWDGSSSQQISRSACGKLTKENRIGSSSGGWVTCTEGLGPHSIVYAFGIGQDASWDRALIENYGVQMFSFDPTPKSLTYILDSKDMVKHGSQHRILAVGLGAPAGKMMRTLRLPTNKKYVSASTVKLGNEKNLKGGEVSVAVMPLHQIMSELEHTRIDLLKIDIEGSEFEVLLDLALLSFIPTNQILVEFHENYFPDRAGDATKRVSTIHSALARNGFEMVYLSADQTEAVFLRFSDN